MTMKKTMQIFGLIIFASICLVGCKQSNTKQKEPEQKNEVLTLKENKSILKENKLSKDSVLKTSKLNDIDKLVINPQNEGSDQGRILITKHSKTLFFFQTNNNKKGKIIINGKEYILSKYTRNKNGSYKFSNDKVDITTSIGKFEEMESDCAYGKLATVIITLNGVSTTIKNVDIQDCPDYN
jgi:hypothetical protein